MRTGLDVIKDLFVGGRIVEVEEEEYEFEDRPDEVFLIIENNGKKYRVNIDSVELHKED